MLRVFPIFLNLRWNTGTSCNYVQFQDSWEPKVTFFASANSVYELQKSLLCHFCPYVKSRK